MRPRTQAWAPSRSAAWRAARPQGHVLPRGKDFHGRQPRSCRIRFKSRPRRCSAAGRSRRDRDRRPEHGGIRRGSDRAQHPLWPLPQRVQRGAYPGRLVERIGGRSCGPRRLRRARLRHRRLDPVTRGLQRRHRVEANLWAREPSWRDAALVEHGSCRPVRTHRARLCATAASHCRARSERRDDECAPGSRLSGKPRRRTPLRPDHRNRGPRRRARAGDRRRDGRERARAGAGRREARPYRSARS